MSKVRIVVMIFVLVFSSVVVAGNNFSIKWGNRIEGIEDVSIRVRYGSVFVYPKYDLWKGDVEITEDVELYVNGDKVDIDRWQEEMVEEYYCLAKDILRDARRIGKEGARVGMQGAKIGLKAVFGVVRLISPDYDTDDLERDLERETDKVEEKAERLEEKAEDLEDLADELEELHVRMRREIGELRELGWF